MIAHKTTTIVAFNLLFLFVSHLVRAEEIKDLLSKARELEQAGNYLEADSVMTDIITESRKLFVKSLLKFLPEQINGQKFGSEKASVESEPTEATRNKYLIKKHKQDYEVSSYCDLTIRASLLGSERDEMDYVCDLQGKPHTRYVEGSTTCLINLVQGLDVVADGCMENTEMKFPYISIYICLAGGAEVIVSLDHPDVEVGEKEPQRSLDEISFEETKESYKEIANSLDLRGIQAAQKMNSVNASDGNAGDVEASLGLDSPASRQIIDALNNQNFAEAVHIASFIKEGFNKQRGKQLLALLPDKLYGNQVQRQEQDKYSRSLKITKTYGQYGITSLSLQNDLTSSGQYPEHNARPWCTHIGAEAVSIKDMKACLTAYGLGSDDQAQAHIQFRRDGLLLELKTKAPRAEIKNELIKLANELGPATVFEQAVKLGLTKRADHPMADPVGNQEGRGFDAWLENMQHSLQSKR